MQRDLLVVAAYDSQLKWAVGLAREFPAAEWSWKVAAPADYRTALSAEQIEAIGCPAPELLSWQELLVAARSADCVVLALQGQLVERFTDELALLRQTRPQDHEPVIVTGWVGIVIEKLVAGYLDRAGSDLVAVNSADNLREFENAGRLLGVPLDNLLLTGLPLLPARPAPLREGPIHRVVFADQPTIPTMRWDRAYVYQRLIDYAVAHPERQVMLKPRHRPWESTFHRMDHHPEEVLAELPPAPPNFSVTYEPITELLATTDLMLTVSSTAGLESVGAGVRTAFIGDLGVHEKHGNQVLLNSGLITTFDELIADNLPVAQQNWLADVFVSVDELTPGQRIVRRVLELLDVPLDQRPGAIVSSGRYVSGRLAIRRLRARLPRAAQVPTPQGGNRSLKAQLRTRLSFLARAVLPAALVRHLAAKY